MHTVADSQFCSLYTAEKCLYDHSHKNKYYSRLVQFLIAPSRLQDGSFTTGFGTEMRKTTRSSRMIGTIFPFHFHFLPYHSLLCDTILCHLTLCNMVTRHIIPRLVDLITSKDILHKISPRNTIPHNIIPQKTLPRKISHLNTHFIHPVPASNISIAPVLAGEILITLIQTATLVENCERCCRLLFDEFGRRDVFS